MHCEHIELIGIFVFIYSNLESEHGRKRHQRDMPILIIHLFCAMKVVKDVLFNRVA